MHDKGVSLGEAATAHIEDLHVSRCGTGIVSKDSSKGFARRVLVENCSVASVMAYVKKPQYGFASLEVTNLTSRNVPRKIVVQKGSRVVIDEQEAQTVDLDVKRLYNAGPMAK